MAQIDARGWIFQVEAATPNTWLAIKGVTELAIDRSEGEEEADTTTFDSGGWQESQAMQRGASLKLTFQEERGTNGALDPGQARQALVATYVGDQSHNRLRFRHISQTTWEQWTAWCGIGEAGGETNDKTKNEATWRLSGTPSYPAVV